MILQAPGGRLTGETLGVSESISGEMSGVDLVHSASTIYEGAPGHVPGGRPQQPPVLFGIPIASITILWFLDIIIKHLSILIKYKPLVDDAGY